MSLLRDEGVDVVHHYTPLHYLPFIARDRALLTKPSLAAKGFALSHLRSKSSPHDISRGFGKYGFLTLERHPKILAAKLKGGFPHIDIAVPPEAVETIPFDLCRYNVAMTRYLRRNGSPGFPESESNGRYYDDHQIPVARGDNDKRALLRAHLNQNMIEVLVHSDLPLPAATVVHVYCDEDFAIANHVLRTLGAEWKVEQHEPPSSYARKANHAEKVDEFIERALSDVSWLGNGLEYDKV